MKPTRLCRANTSAPMSHTEPKNIIATPTRLLSRRNSMKFHTEGNTNIDVLLFLTKPNFCSIRAFLLHFFSHSVDAAISKEQLLALKECFIKRGETRYGSERTTQRKKNK